MTFLGKPQQVSGSQVWDGSKFIATVITGAGGGGGSGGTTSADTWETLHEVDFTTLATQDFVAGGDGSYTINGLTWIAENTAAANTSSLINGTGLVIQVDGTNTVYNPSTRTAPMLVLRLSELTGALGTPPDVEIRFQARVLVEDNTQTSEIMKLALENSTSLDDNATITRDQNDDIGTQYGLNGTNNTNALAGTFDSELIYQLHIQDMRRLTTKYASTGSSNLDWREIEDYEPAGSALVGTATAVQQGTSWLPADLTSENFVFAVQSGGTSRDIKGTLRSLRIQVKDNTKVPVPTIPTGSADIYYGFASGALNWTATTWTDVTTVATNFSESLVDGGITRSGSTFTVAEAGKYYWNSYFNTFGSTLGWYVGFRLSGSNGTIIQHTNFNANSHAPGTLQGILDLGAGDSFKLEYAGKSGTGTAAAWSPSDPLDGENMRTGEITMFRIDPGTVSGSGGGSGGDGNLIWQSDTADVAFTTGSIEVTGSATIKGGISGSLTTLDTGAPYLLAGDNITLVTNSLGQVVVSSSLSASVATDYYKTSVTSSIEWTATTWTDVTTVISGFVDTVADGNITRSGSVFTVTNAGQYYWDSNLNESSTTGYFVGFRLSSSNGSILQHTQYLSEPQVGQLQGVVDLTAGESVRFQYATKDDAGTSAQWGPNNPLDGENMRTGTITMFRLGGGGSGGGGDSFFYSTTNGLIEQSGSIRVTGSVTAQGGLSGSLTTLSDGLPYLLAGDNVTLVTNSQGQIEISSSGGSGGGGTTTVVFPQDGFSLNTIFVSGTTLTDLRQAAGDFTIGNTFSVSEEREITGVRFAWRTTSSIDVLATLWDNTNQIASATVTVTSGTRIYDAVFATPVNVTQSLIHADMAVGVRISDATGYSHINASDLKTIMPSEPFLDVEKSLKWTDISTFAAGAARPGGAAVTERYAVEPIITPKSQSVSSTTNVVSGSEWITLYDVDFTSFANQDVSTDGLIDVTGSTGAFTWDRINNSNALFMSYSNGEGLAIQVNGNNSDFFNNVRTGPAYVLPLSGVVPGTANFDEIDLKIETVVSLSNQTQDFELVKTILEISSAIGSATNVGPAIVYNTSEGPPSERFQVQATTAGSSINSSEAWGGENITQIVVTEPYGANIYSAGSGSADLPAPDQYTPRAWARWNSATSNKLQTTLPNDLRDLNYVFVVASANTSRDIIGYLQKFRIQYRPKGGILSGSGGGGSGSGDSFFFSRTAGVVEQSGSLRMSGSLSGSGIQFIPQATNPGTVPSGTLYVDDGTNYETGSLIWKNKAVFEGETSVGAPGFEQGSIDYVGGTFDAIFKVNDFGGGRDAIAIFHRHSTIDGANVVFARANTNDATHAASADNSEIANLIFAGHDGTDYNPAATIQADIDGVVASNEMPGKLVFRVSPSASNVPATAFTIRENRLGVFESDVHISGNLVVDGTFPVTTLNEAYIAGNRIEVNTSTGSLRITGSAGSAIATVLINSTDSFSHTLGIRNNDDSQTLLLVHSADSNDGGAGVVLKSSGSARGRVKWVDGPPTSALVPQAQIFYEDDSQTLVVDATGSLEARTDTYVTGQLHVGPASGIDNLFVDPANRRVGINTNTFTEGITADTVISSDDTTGGVATLKLINAAGANGLPFLSFVEGTTDVGNIAGHDTEEFGLVNGITIGPSTGRQLGFRFGATNVGRWTASGLFVTGTLRITSDFSAGGGGLFNSGLTGALNTLPDGSPYLQAGANITLATGSNGQITIASTGGGSGQAVTTEGSLLGFGITDYASTTNTSSSPEAVGQLVFDSSKHDGAVTLRAILTAASASVSASVKLLNLDDQAFVEIGGSGIDFVSSVGTTSTAIETANLKNQTGFNALSASNYELQLYSSNGLIPVIVGGAEFVVTGQLVAVPPNSGSFLSFGITDYATTQATGSSPESVGQLIFDPSQYTGPLNLRGVLSTTTGSVTASMRLLNVTSGALVHIGGASVTELTTLNITPTVVESVNLRTATNFSSGQAVYELQLFTEDGAQSAFVGGAEFRATGSVGAPPTRLNLGSYTSLTATSSNPQAVGGGYFLPSEHNSNACVFRAILSTTTGSNAALVQLYNVTSGALVHIGGSGITELSSSATAPTNVESVDLLTATNFNASAASVYEVRVFGSGSSPTTFIHNSELVCS